MSLVKVKTVQPDDLPMYLDSLSELLHACVLEGASVNFLLPYEVEQARAFWASQVGDIAARRSLLCVAIDSHSANASGSATVLGCVLVKLAQQPNQAHRCDIGKMLVSPGTRRRLIGWHLDERLQP